MEIGAKVPPKVTAGAEFGGELAVSAIMNVMSSTLFVARGHVKMRIFAAVFTGLISLISQMPASAQNRGAKIVSSRPAPDLKARYNSLICAIVLIHTERGAGTGFFVDRTGDIVTAAHVVSTKNFHANGNQLSFEVAVDKSISVQPHAGSVSEIAASQVDVEAKESSADLAFIHTNLTPGCWIPLGNSSAIQTGDHVLAIGFPGIDDGNPILYEGFLSGRFKHPPIPVAQVDGKPVVPNYEVMKIQMPITPGASGSPVVDDSNHVVGVISESPMIWTQDLENIIRAGGSGVALGGYDPVKILGELAFVVREFESTGSGYAVPVSYLDPKRASSQPSSPGVSGTH